MSAPATLVAPSAPTSPNAPQRWWNILPEFRQGLESAQRHGLRALVPSLNVGLGYALLLSGSLNEAIAALSEAHEIGSGSGRVLVRMWAATGLAAAYGSTGGRIPALRFADEAVQLGAPILANIILVGALAGTGVLPIEREEFSRAIAATVRRSAIAINLKAFDIGRQMVN